MHAARAFLGPLGSADAPCLSVSATSVHEPLLRCSMTVQSRSNLFLCYQLVICFVVIIICFCYCCLLLSLFFVFTMPRGRYNVLRRQTRKMVVEVFNFMKKEAEDGLQYDLKCVQKRTAAATGVSERTLRRIIAATKEPSSSLLTVFRTPGKKRIGKKTITGIN